MTRAAPIKSVAIIGGGTAGWMTAAALSRTLDTRQTSVTLIESEQIGTVGVGEATLPNIATFNRMLGIDEPAFMAATHATIKYGIEFVDWGQKGESYFHPFGTHGADMDGISFHHYWRALKSRDPNTPPIESFCMTAMAAAAGKALMPQRDPRSPLSRLAYAFQFDATAYAAYLRDYSEARGVSRREGKVVDVSLRKNDGFISSVTMMDGTEIKADLFIDCSGFRSLLLGKALGTDYDDWSHYLPVNSAQAVPCEKVSPALPYTRCTAKRAGWQWRIPLQHRTGNGYVYASDYIDDDAVTTELLGSLGGTPTGEVKQLRFTTGQRKDFWVKNCIGLGLSAGFLEPLESTSIYLIQTGITKLLALFPDSDFKSVERDEYNKIMHKEFEQVRDFLMLHYIATKRNDDAFWDYVRTMPVPDSLQNKLDLFKGNGRFFRYDGDLFTETSWVAVFLGQNIMPEGYNPLVDAIEPQQLQDSLGSMQNAIAKAARAMPSHEDFLKQYGAISTRQS
ncbi:tryptophan halogenase family protein [Fretibacter rubidus]|uniref:tryptophan halogenase family protein n=1 Tax=Fretibacter rubidus TaxID=570162 RepID=UPI00352AB905